MKLISLSWRHYRCNVRRTTLDHLETSYIFDTNLDNEKANKIKTNLQRLDDKKKHLNYSLGLQS